MKHLSRILLPLFGFFLTCLAYPSQAEDTARRFDPKQLAGLDGGLIVQLGATDTHSATALSLTGRYLIHVLDPDAERVASAQASIRRSGHYGLAWAEQSNDSARLPYAENVVNMIIARDYALPAAELLRVLTPNGTLVVEKARDDKTGTGVLDEKDSETLQLSEASLAAAGFESIVRDARYVIARKPWPDAMDEWSHSRHAADGNAVSLDTLVGPPERVRWIAAATSEVEGMVTAGGRNFYGGILARDSFNGLRLWHRDLAKKENNPVVFTLPKLPNDASRPVASRKFLFAVLAGKPTVLDAATGEIAVEFGEMTKPTAILFDTQRLIVAEDKTVRAFDVDSGKELWNFASAEPRNVIGDGKHVGLIQGRVRRGEKAVAVVLDANSGELKWSRDDYAWLGLTSRTVLSGDQLVFEVSTLNDNDAGNGIHVVSASTGEPQWSKDFPPGMNHARQARAMFLEDDLWILHGGKINTGDEANKSRLPTEVSALDPLSGIVRKTLPAGLTHCFPPVATPNYMFAGELDMTDLKTGDVIANRITKANCSRESGWIPANGLIYTTPKHCTCWPMLRGFVAMAPTTSEHSPASLPVEQLDFPLERGTASVDANAAEPSASDWPLYRHDRWRSASSVTAGPKKLATRWTASLKDEIAAEAKLSGPILHDWQENPIVKGPLSPPTIAVGIAYVTRPNAHELVAIDTESGDIRWRFTANGRLDTPPAIYRGLCLFGTAAGWVYALRADDGELVWRMRAAPSDERIVAYGQVESPWPVPGAVLVMDDIAYFAAGRQPLADGGILVFAVDPLTGQRHWVKRIDSVPQKGFYENSGLEFDPFDILHAEGDSIAMSRWIISPDGKEINVDKWNAFAKLNTGAGEVWIPRGSWTYGARHQHRFAGEASRRPLTVFRDDNVYSSLDGSTNVFRRDFNLEKGEEFNNKWITGWEAVKTARDGGKPYRSERIAQNALWTQDPFDETKETKLDPAYGTQLYNEIYAMALAGDEKLYVVHRDGRMKVISTESGYVIDETTVPPPAWDGLAIAGERVYLTTQDGKLVCIGE